MSHSNEKELIEKVENLKVSTEISALTDLLLVKILKYLNIDELKNASLVSKKWLEVIQRPEFDDGYCLKLQALMLSRHCPPWSVLQRNTIRRKFPHIVVNMYLPANNQDEVQFYQEFGRFTTKITLGRGFNEHSLFWKQSHALKMFPNLKKIEADTIGDLMSFDIPETIECIKVETIVPFHKNSQDIKKLKELKLKVKSFTTRKIEVWHNQTDFEHFFTIDNELMEVLKKSGQKTFDVNEVNLVTIDKIGFSELSCALSNFASYGWDTIFKTCPNLTSNVTRYKENGCFFTHEVIPMKNFKSTNLLMVPEVNKPWPNVCEKCLSCFIESCPNIEGWVLQGMEGNMQKVLDAMKNPPDCLALDFRAVMPDISRVDCSKLQCLILMGGPPDVHLSCLSWPEMPHLEKIILQDGIFLNEVNFKILTLKCPAVTSFTMYSPITFQSYMNIMDAWPYLKNLTINFDTNISNLDGVMDSLPGNFKTIRNMNIIFILLEGNRRHVVEAYHPFFFVKNPTLRSFNKFPYIKYCQDMFKRQRKIKMKMLFLKR